MEARIEMVRSILNRLTNANEGRPRHSGKGRFWNGSRDDFVNGPIYGKKPIEPGDSANSFLIHILAGPVDGFSQMPPGGPYVSDQDLRYIKEWIDDGAPDSDDVFNAAYLRGIEKA